MGIAAAYARAAGPFRDYGQDGAADAAAESAGAAVPFGDYGLAGATQRVTPDQQLRLRYRALYDKIHRMPQEAFVPDAGFNWTRKEQTKMIKLWIKSKGSNVVFETFVQRIVNKPLAVYVIPSEQYSTLTTDNVGSMAGIMRLYYKDV